MNKTVNIDEFLETANIVQKGLLYTMRDLAQKEHELCTEYNKRYEVFKDLDKLVVNKAYVEEKESLQRLDTQIEGVKDKMKLYLKKAVQLDMSSLGIIQRQYEAYVGQKIPNS